MGWCQAFGPQIREGCDHAMVAGDESCHCPECGVVCSGKFAGCSAVWAAGPQAVNLRRPPRESSAPKALASTNGSQPAAAEAMAVLSPVRVPYSSADLNGDLRPLLNALRAEMQVLSRKVDQIQGSTRSFVETGRSNDRALSVTEALPGRIAKAVADALHEQHRAMLVELRVLKSQLAADVESVHGVLEQPSSSDRLVKAFDARFEWLVNELSERFVILGNEIVRVDRSVAAQDHGRQSIHTQLKNATAPLLLEIARLNRRLDSLSPGAVSSVQAQ